MVSQRLQLKRVSFQPRDPGTRELEVISMAELRERVASDHFREAQRVEFHLLIAVTRGRCRHWVDFEPHDCAPRSWVIVQPGQAQRWDATSRWDGWAVLFRPQVLLPHVGTTLVADLAASSGTTSLPNHLRLDPGEHEPCMAGVEQMRADADRFGPGLERDELRRHELHALLLRLRLAQLRRRPATAASPRLLMQFRRFQDAVQADFAECRQVRDYTERLGYSEKNLRRLTQRVVGMSPKAYVTQRIMLEAKRLLVHTTQAVGRVGQQLGFDETTNFVKFFKREAGCTPAEFRHRNR